MTQQHAEVQPVPVRVTNHEDLAGMRTRARPRTHLQSVFRTFVLTAAQPVIPILAEDLSRETAWIVAIGNSVVLCNSQSQAQDPDNFIAGAGIFAECPANPQGTLLYVPTLTAPWTSQPVPVSVRWTLNTTEVVWASAMVYPALVSVTIESKAQGY
jgi:hypothetical protein